MRLDLDGEQLRKVARNVSVLRTSIDTLESKLAYLEREIGLSPAELRDWVVKNPILLGRSLANSYRPRLEVCRAAGVDAKRVLTYASRADEIFCEKIGIAPEALVAARESVLSV